MTSSGRTLAAAVTSRAPNRHGGSGSVSSSHSLLKQGIRYDGKGILAAKGVPCLRLIPYSRRVCGFILRDAGASDSSQFEKRRNGKKGNADLQQFYRVLF